MCNSDHIVGCKRVCDNCRPQLAPIRRPLSNTTSPLRSVCTPRACSWSPISTRCCVWRVRQASRCASRTSPASSTSTTRGAMAATSACALDLGDSYA